MEVNTYLLSCFLLLTLTVFSYGKHIFCYYSSFAQTRNGVGKFLPEDINPHLCTHLIYAFVDITSDGRGLKPFNRNDQGPKGLYARTIALKKKNPALKVLLAVGGWQIGSKPFIPMIKDEKTRKTWIKNVVRYLRNHGFDGFDMDWEFPATRGSSPEDKYRFTLLMKGLYEAFANEAKDTGREKLLLTLATASGTYYIDQSYEPYKIIHYIDFMLLMSYNYHGQWEKVTGHHSGLYPHRDDPKSGEKSQLYQEWSIDYWLDMGIPKEKLVVGIPTYGMTFTLADPSRHGLHAPAIGGGNMGDFTKETGILSYYEVCMNLRTKGWTDEWIDDQSVPYAYKTDQWVGYENKKSFAFKAANIIRRDLAGAFVWSVEMDDFRGLCGHGQFPLISTLVDAFGHGLVSQTAARERVTPANHELSFRIEKRIRHKTTQEPNGNKPDGIPSYQVVTKKNEIWQTRHRPAGQDGKYQRVQTVVNFPRTTPSASVDSDSGEEDSTQKLMTPEDSERSYPVIKSNIPGKDGNNGESFSSGSTQVVDMKVISQEVNWFDYIMPTVSAPQVPEMKHGSPHVDTKDMNNDLIDSLTPPHKTATKSFEAIDDKLTLTRSTPSLFDLKRTRLHDANYLIPHWIKPVVVDLHTLPSMSTAPAHVDEAKGNRTEAGAEVKALWWARPSDNDHTRLAKIPSRPKYIHDRPHPTERPSMLWWKSGRQHDNEALAESSKDGEFPASELPTDEFYVVSNWHTTRWWASVPDHHTTEQFSEDYALKGRQIHVTQGKATSQPAALTGTPRQSSSKSATSVRQDVCRSKGVGTFPDPLSCDHFIMCLPGNWRAFPPHLMACPDGTRFDASLKICNYAANVPCRL